MSNITAQAQAYKHMDKNPALVGLFRSDLWSLPLFRLPGALMTATRVIPVRVGKLCAASETFSPKAAPFPTTTSSAAGLLILSLCIYQYPIRWSSLDITCFLSATIQPNK
ncbi:hypothetical protein OnM2_057036 [Erysiphe neolycopersici]|uniref:Uncharacterized protein n=1 Tax=Erysiphe neolycopersici TaxID=212602 RepID=A0A420HQS4_9PEZI|nr:hypothetical protein OnM2_057036 [Erysiphe neolycopersici]